MFEGIVTLGSKKNDPHVQSVDNVLQETSTPHLVIDWAEAPKILLHQSSAGKITFEVNDIPISQRCIYWHRVKIIKDSFCCFDSSNQRESALLEGEWRGFYKNLSWIFESQMRNDRRSSIKGHSKVYQQKIASNLGFKVPETLVVNEKKLALSLSNKHESLIAKSLNSYLIPGDPNDNKVPSYGTGIGTIRITSDAIKKHAKGSFQKNPIFLQEEIQKSYELRVQVIGNDVISFKINSQSKELTEVDWRSGFGLELFERINIPDDIAQRLRLFLKKTGLFFGAFDLIVDAYDNYWFLECNPEGQWEWLNELTDNEIGKSFAHNLTREWHGLLSS